LLTFVKSLKKNSCADRTQAESVNGILKDKFMLGETLASYELARQMVAEAVDIYNNERPHQSLKYATPSMRHVA
jgi:putative transposase